MSISGLKRYLPTAGREPFLALMVFVLYFSSAEIGLYIFREYQTSPAVIWPPVGIGFAAVLLFGYRMWAPIFLAQLLFILAEITRIPLTAAIPIAAGYALQPVLASYCMQLAGFRPKLGELKNVLIFTVAALFATILAPLLNTSIQLTLGLLQDDFWLVVMRAWGGGIFSVVVISPLVLSWYPWKEDFLKISEATRRELLTAFAALFVINYLLFSTEFFQNFGIIAIFVLPIILVWFILRFHRRWMLLAIFATAVFSIVAVLLTPEAGSSVSQQLVAVEVYLGLTALLFLIFASVMEERAVAFRQLKRDYRSTAASDSAKTEFIAVLAHELRNPLATVVSCLEYMSLRNKDETDREFLINAENHTDMMQRLLEDLLDTVRLTQGKFSLRKEPAKLDEIIRQSVESVSNFLKEKNLTIVTESKTRPDLQLLVDPVRLRQILINLLTNACKYTEPGGTITTCTQWEDGELLIQVADTGIGISEDAAKHLYEPFHQVHTHTERGTGLGIGLFITKKLVEMHGGHIEAANRTDEPGSVFSVYLPTSVVIENDSAKLLSEAHTVAEDASVHFLVVDDNKPAADLLGKLLRHYGHEAEVSYSGAEALVAVKSARPNVIILDIGMPDMNGYEIARALRDNNYTGTIIALSGYGQVEDKERAEEAGFDHYLVKPASASDIFALLDDE